MGALDRFSEITRSWFTAAFAAPTSAQEQGWEAISAGRHTLILAPTGSGKTLAAFLWALDRLASQPKPAAEASPSAGKRTRRAKGAAPARKPAAAPGGVRVLYVSPLKALIYDVERNLRAPLGGMAREAARLGLAVPQVSVGTRTGDTPAAERRALALHPPDVLVTTPESLYLLLTSEARSILSTVEHVIIDEIHALAPTKRGAHLALSLERLELLLAKAGRPSPQRIGLSATQRPLDEVARFLGGRAPVAADTGADASSPPSGAAVAYAARPVTVVDTGIRKQLDLQVIVPVEDMSQLGKPLLDADGQPVMAGAAAGDPEQRASIWPAIEPRLLELIHQHTSTLIFVNSRRLAERLAGRLNDRNETERRERAEAEGSVFVPEVLVRAHHGSLAREQRVEIEDALKAGRLPALVATSSLELGIDMGAIDLVIQVESPQSVASGLQRIGRAGHQVGEPSRGRVFPKFRGDLLSAAVVGQRMHAGLVEETVVPRHPIDVLCQQIVAMAALEPTLPVDDIARVARGAYPFADLSDDVLHGVLDLLSGRYPSDEFAELRPRLTWDRLHATVAARPGARLLAVTNAGTIPDRGLYSVVTPEGTRVGELDEEMVFESRVGETFLLGASTWRIEDITPDRVVVTPAPGIPGKMPFWHGDKVGRPFELGAAIGEFTRTLEQRSDDELAHTYGLDEFAIGNLRRYVAEEREATDGQLPTDRQIVVQRFRDELGDWQLCVLSPFGARVHAPWAMAIEARIREQLGMEARAIWSDDGIIVRLPEADEAPPAEYVLIDPDELDDLLVAELGASALFSSRFRENAARALLLPRRKPGQRTPLWRQRQRSADLLRVASRYGTFPILLETYRECLRDVFDVPALSGLLRDLRARRIRLVSLDMAQPSPFASTLAFGYIANFMYDGDAPLAERRAAALALDRDLLAELLGSEELRELIDPRALAAVEDELQCLEPRRHARTVDAVHDLLRRLGDLSGEELAARCAGGAAFATEAIAALVRERRAISVRVAGELRVIASADAARYRDALAVMLPAGVPSAYLEWEGPDDPLVSLVVRYARTHAPFTAAELAARFGIAESVAHRALLARGDTGLLLSGAFRPEGAGEEWCDTEVLRQLRQRSLAVLRKEIEPTSTDALARFLPEWHGIGASATGGGLDRCFEVLAQLQGVALPASVWERDVLGARMARYHGRLLDELLAAGEVIWVGAGALGRDDGRLAFYLREQAPLLVPEPAADPPSEPEHERLRALLAGRGACYFRDLDARSDAVTLDALWDLVWAGEVTNDGFACVRALAPGRKASVGGSGGAATRRTGRPRLGSLTVLGPPRAQGRWSLVARELGRTGSPPPAGQVAGGVAEDAALQTVAAEVPDVAAAAERADGAGAGAATTRTRTAKGARLAAERAVRTEQLHALAVSLLERHGVLTREAIRGEGVSGGFAGLYPVLKQLEEAGRVRRGYFVAGLGGAQFAVPGAVDRLRAVREPATVPEVAVLAACDPANPYGWALPWPVRGPQRAAGAYVVLVDGLPSLYLERGGRSLVALRDFDGEWEEHAVKAVAATVGPEQDRAARFRRLVFEKVPPELESMLRTHGFVPTPKGLARYG